MWIFTVLSNCGKIIYPLLSYNHCCLSLRAIGHSGASPLPTEPPGRQRPMGFTTIQFAMNRTVFHARRAHWYYASQDAPWWSSKVIEVPPRAHRGSKRHFRECIHSTALRVGLSDTTFDSRHLQTATRYPGFRNCSTILSWQSSKLFLEVSWSVPGCHPVFPGCHVQVRQE